jgi:hypothetical protein
MDCVPTIPGRVNEDDVLAVLARISWRSALADLRYHDEMLELYRGNVELRLTLQKLLASIDEKEKDI